MDVKASRAGGGAASTVGGTAREGKAEAGSGLGASSPAARVGVAALATLKNFTFLLAVLVAWELISTLWLPRVDRHVAILMPAPSSILKAAGELLASGELIRHLLASLKREAVAFCFASSAIPIGIAMGWWRTAFRQLNPVIEVLRPIPPLAWIPLSILWFGIGDTQNQFIIFLGMFFPILINTFTGVRNIETNLIRAARSLGANEGNVLRRIVFKAALPQIVTGIRIGLGVGWMALVAAELVGASSGLGFLINDARSVLRTDYIFVGMITIGLAGLVIDATLRAVMSRLLPWSQALGH
jgi:NitT/TauT family transport system permease protein/taurine transport system permease protein